MYFYSAKGTASIINDNTNKIVKALKLETAKIKKKVERITKKEMTRRHGRKEQENTVWTLAI